MTKRQLFNIDAAHASWQPCISQALTHMDQAYLEHLYHSTDWLPGHQKIFNAFSLPLNQVKYILVGESPYPRIQSANGYAFWDAAVDSIWSASGLSKAVNRATSLRNIIKMLLVAEGELKPTETNQEAIARVNKQRLIQTNYDLFNNLIQNGFLLLNASLVLQPTAVQKDAKAWYPFIKHILDTLYEKNPSAALILFGQIAHVIDQITAHHKVKKLYAEHPYNISFITNQQVIDFFKPLHILCYNKC